MRWKFWDTPDPPRQTFDRGEAWFAVVDEEERVAIGPLRTLEQVKTAINSTMWPDNVVLMYSTDGQIREIPRVNQVVGKPVVTRDGMRPKEV